MRKYKRKELQLQNEHNAENVKNLGRRMKSWTIPSANNRVQNQGKQANESKHKLIVSERITPAMLKLLDISAQTCGV